MTCNVCDTKPVDVLYVNGMAWHKACFYKHLEELGKDWAEGYGFTVLRRKPRKIQGYDQYNTAKRLSEDDVVAIRKAYAEGDITMLTLAKQHSVDISTVSNVINYKTWRHV